MVFQSRVKIVYLILGTSMLFSTGCSTYDNFTTYFNTYYNMERIMWECEDEFAFQDEKKRIDPRTFIPQPENYYDDKSTTMPPFLNEFVVTKAKRQPVETKLDSIIIKGSKILAKHSKSNYIDGSLFLMAKSFFYQEDWLNSQIKCSELVDKFPNGDLSPDAHLLFAKNLLIQRQFNAGETLLSRTVDIAWRKKRYDILSEAFRLEAELALYQGDMEKAFRPYRQAVAQADDSEMKARWQLDLALLLYRVGKFDKAEEEFRKVFRYSTDYVQRFETHLYRAGCLMRMKHYDEAMEILDDLENDGKYEEWKGYVYGQKLELLQLMTYDKEYQAKLEASKQDGEVPVNEAAIATMEKYVDTAYTNNPLVVTYYYERGEFFYKSNDYGKARKYYAKARLMRTPVFTSANTMFNFMNEWDIKNKLISSMDKQKDQTDSTKQILSQAYFEMGRVQEQLNKNDSALYYYRQAAETSPIKDENSARYIYAYARLTRDKDAFKADSLLDIIVATHPLTPYGKDARIQLGYTESFVIDTVADLFASGSELMRTGDYYFAKTQFTKLYTTYPKSKFAPRSIYNLGWMYENKLEQLDTALFYYQMLIDKYPGTDYARDVHLSVDYYLALKSGKPLPDSLKTRQVVRMPPPDPIRGMPQPMRPIPGQVKPNQLSPKDMLKDPKSLLSSPGNILDKAKQLISDPVQQIKDIKMPENPISDPAKFFNLDDQKNDSTKTESNHETPPPQEEQPPK